MEYSMDPSLVLPAWRAREVLFSPPCVRTSIYIIGSAQCGDATPMRVAYLEGTLRHKLENGPRGWRKAYMICPRCGLDLGANSLSRCPQCGQPLQAPMGRPAAHH